MFLWGNHSNFQEHAKISRSIRFSLMEDNMYFGWRGAGIWAKNMVSTSLFWVKLDWDMLHFSFACFLSFYIGVCGDHINAVGRTLSVHDTTMRITMRIRKCHTISCTPPPHRVLYSKYVVVEPPGGAGSKFRIICCFNDQMKVEMGFQQPQIGSAQLITYLSVL